MRTVGTIRASLMTCLLAGAMALLAACATTLDGPVHAYAGAPRPVSELAEIRIPAGVNLLSVDATEYTHGEAGPKGVPLYLTPGRHQIVVNYSEVFGDPTAAVTYTSDTFVFDVDVRAGERYRLVHNGPDEPAAIEAPESDIVIALVDAAGVRHAAARRLPAGGILSQLGVVPSPTASAPAPAAAPAPRPVAAPAAAATPDPVAPPSSAQVLEALRTWWQRATPEERAEFRKWIVDHP